MYDTLLMEEKMWSHDEPISKNVTSSSSMLDNLPIYIPELGVSLCKYFLLVEFRAFCTRNFQ